MWNGEREMYGITSLDDPILDKYDITETPIVKFEAKDFDKETNFIEIKMPHLLGFQLRKHRLDHGINYFYLDVMSPNGIIKTFNGPKTCFTGIEYYLDKLTIRLLT